MIASSSMASAIMGAAAAKSMSGQDMEKLARSLSDGIVPNILSKAQVITVDNGTSGSGTGTGGFASVVSSDLESKLLSQFAANSMMGEKIPDLANVLATGIASEIQKSQVQTIVAGVGPGSGTGYIMGLDPSSMQGQIMGMFATNGLSGQDIVNLAAAVAAAVVQFISSLTVTTVDTGSTTTPPSSATGSGTGKIL